MADGAHPTRSRLIRLMEPAAGTSTEIALELDRGRSYRIVAHTRSRKSEIIEQLVAQADVAVVMTDGGLINNLKVWENLWLPAAYPASADMMQIEHNAAG